MVLISILSAYGCTSPPKQVPEATTHYTKNNQLDHPSKHVNDSAKNQSLTVRPKTDPRKNNTNEITSISSPRLEQIRRDPITGTSATTPPEETRTPRTSRRPQQPNVDGTTRHNEIRKLEDILGRIQQRLNKSILEGSVGRDTFAQPKEDDTGSAEDRRLGTTKPK